MLALGDALALVVSRMRDFAKDDFYVYHPVEHSVVNWPKFKMSCVRSTNVASVAARNPCDKFWVQVSCHADEQAR